MPQLLNGTGAAQWGDVENHPWTTGMQLDYFTEASLWAEWLKTEVPERRQGGGDHVQQRLRQELPERLQARHQGHRHRARRRGAARADGAEPDNQYTTLAATGADVLLLQTTGAFCTQGDGRVEKGYVEADRDHVGHLRLADPVLQAADRPGPAPGKDTYLIQTFKDVNDPANADDRVRQAVPRRR